MITLAIHQCLDRATALLRAKTVCFSWGDFFFSFFLFYLFVFVCFLFFAHLRQSISLVTQKQQLK